MTLEELRERLQQGDDACMERCSKIPIAVTNTIGDADPKLVQWLEDMQQARTLAQVCMLVDAMILERPKPRRWSRRLVEAVGTVAAIVAIVGAIAAVPVACGACSGLYDRAQRAVSP